MYRRSPLRRPGFALPKRTSAVRFHPDPHEPPLYQRQQLLRIQLPAHLRAVEQAVGEVTFAGVELHDFLLDSVLCHEAADGHRAKLPHGVGTVAGLVLHGGVPPGVEVHPAFPLFFKIAFMMGTEKTPSPGGAETALRSSVLAGIGWRF